MLWTTDWISQFSFLQCVTKCINWPLRDIEMKSTSDAIFTFRREQNISFSLYKQGTDARRLHYFNLWIAFLDQGIEMYWIFLDSLVQCQWEDDVLRRTLQGNYWQLNELYIWENFKDFSTTILDFRDSIYFINFSFCYYGTVFIVLIFIYNLNFKYTY